MAKETKNLLKKADCQRELFKSRSFRLRQCIPLAIILSLFLIPLSIVRKRERFFSLPEQELCDLIRKYYRSLLAEEQT